MPYWKLENSFWKFGVQFEKRAIPHFSVLLKLLSNISVCNIIP